MLNVLKLLKAFHANVIKILLEMVSKLIARHMAVNLVAVNARNTLDGFPLDLYPVLVGLHSNSPYFL